MRKVFQHFQTLEMRRRKRCKWLGYCVWGKQQHFSSRNVVSVKSCKRQCVKKSQKAVLSSPILDYFWRATCRISHCRSQKSCQGFLHIFSAWFTGTMNYSCRVCLCQFTCISWAHPSCVLQSWPLSQCCFWNTDRSHRKNANKYWSPPTCKYN